MICSAEPLSLISSPERKRGVNTFGKHWSSPNARYTRLAGRGKRAHDVLSLPPASVSLIPQMPTAPASGLSRNAIGSARAFGDKRTSGFRNSR